MNRTKRNAILLCVVVIILAACLWAAHGRVHFDWANLRTQLRAVNWAMIGAAVAAIWISAAFRAIRWRILLGRVGQGRWWNLIAAQFIGFTAVGIFGRVVDLARPYLIARRTRTSVATQLAVYSMERAFDLGAAAVLFSITLVFTPRDMPHHEAFIRAGAISLGATVFLALLAILIRFSGETLAHLSRRWLCIVSKDFANNIAEKLLEFRTGLMAIEGATQFMAAAMWSLVLWALIAYAYWQTAHAFRSSPELSTFSVPADMLLMATSMGGSLFQLPIVGWFTQIGVLGGALHLFFSVPLEVASAAGALMFAVTNLSIIPVGLIAARIEGVALREAAHSAEVAAESEEETTA